MESRGKSLTEEVDDLAIAILRMAARDHQSLQEGGDHQSSPPPTRSGGAARLVGGDSLNVSAVSTHADDNDTLVGASPPGVRRPTAGVPIRKAPLPGTQRGTDGSPRTDSSNTFMRAGADRQIAAILRAPGGEGLVASNRSSNVSSPAMQVQGNAQSPLRNPTRFQPSPLDPSTLSRQVHPGTVHGVYAATMEQVAENMTRLVRSAALLEAETRLTADERAIMDSSPSRAATGQTWPPSHGYQSSSPRMSSPVRSPMSRTLPPTAATVESTLISSRTDSHYDERTVMRLEEQVRSGREQTKDLIHELHLLEVRMQRELATKDREYQDDRDAWREERAAMQARLEDYASQVASLKEEKAKWLTMLQEMGEGRMEAHELARNTAVQLQLLGSAHEREAHALKKQYEEVKAQLGRVRAQRDAAESKLAKQGHHFAAVAEQIIRSDARVRVLQHHIHDLHSRDQQKDEHLHDVAQFVKKSLAPFVLELDGLQHTTSSPLEPPVCRQCRKHHAFFDGKASSSTPDGK